ncbi:PQQ-binding-like beta-propeller repeat protein [Spirosoma sp.]|uniref:outer membrane protein assembly factor BamB family protein n=1 Tax=Spirosoma sp. TaxID=1899569 RepID=UPI0026067707|nr:PQQ-binding-like beta-propeller repeat protein [Spirosoma sp.]MCX6214874.1 PQQ-binding-like beta-propeller repeat protein [Spirosoma sp.]
MKNLFISAGFICLFFHPGLKAQQPAKPKAALTANLGVFTRKQAEAGAAMFATHCAACHGRDLRGTEGGNALVGERFVGKWSTQSVGQLFDLTKSSMPKTNPHSLDDASYASLVAFILNANGFPEGDVALPSATARLKAIPIGTPPPSSRVSMQFKPAVYTEKPITIEGDWRQHRSDYASSNYSPLSQINKDNAKQLKIAWRWKTDNFGPNPEFYFKSTPLMVNGMLFTTAGSNRTVAAIHAETGETLWTFRFDEKDRKTYVPRQNSGRGVAYWTSPDKGKDRVIYITPSFQLIALNAQTGQLISDFGDNGVVDLKKGLGPHVDPLTSTIGSTSPPIIVNDVIIMGASFPVGLAPTSKKQVRGDIMGYDVKTGKQLWIFRTIPQADEAGNETWEKDSWQYTGNAGAWAPLTADPALGYVYLPLEAATGDFYGGHRPGNNLFSQSLVCLDAKTGKKVWHYQLIHHDIWDYDLPAPPILADIRVDGKPIKAIVQVTKQAFAFVFDRVTGKPVWPIEERPVPKSDVKGEWTSPTQPFPTKPAAFDRQGYSDDILVDFTPEIKKAALKIVSRYKKGPLFTPVSVYDPPKNLGTLMLPDAVGGANWQGGVVDPETGMLYVSSSTVIRPMSLEAAPAISDMDYVAYMGNARIGPYGLPLVKPPYGRITAIDLNTGDHKWMVPNADTPSWVKDVPALKGIKIPRTGLPDRVGMLVTKTLLFAGEGAGLYGSDGGGGNKFRAYDKATGNIISEIELPANQSGLPMTYSMNGKQYIVVAVGAVGHPGELVALSL